MAKFGYDTIGSSPSIYCEPDVLIGDGPWSPAAGNGVVNSISLRVSGADGRHFTFGLYAESAGEPAALLGVTGEVTVSGDGEQWITGTFASPPSVTNGVDYFLGFVHDGTRNNWYYDGVAGIVNDYRNSVTYSAGSLPNPWGTRSGQDADLAISIYATYTPTGSLMPVLLAARRRRINQ